MRFVAGFGKTNVDLLYSGMPRVPQEGEEIYARQFSMQLGGGVPATLVHLGRLGVPAQIQTLLGDDAFSRFAQEQFTQNGVDVHNLYQGGAMPINLTSAVITPRDRAFASYTDPVAVTPPMQEQARALSQGAAIVLMQDDMLSIYPALKESGSLLVYDTGWREDMSLDAMRPMLALANYYLPNEKEALKVTGAATAAAAAHVLAQFFDHVTIKLGDKGCLIYHQGRQTVIPPLPNITAVDTTGAGDAFLAGFVYGLYHGAPIPRCAAYGNILGAACVAQVGCLSCCLSEQELLQQAAQYYPGL